MHSEWEQRTVPGRLRNNQLWDWLMGSQGLLDAKSSPSGNWSVDEVLINQLPRVGWGLMRSVDCRARSGASKVSFMRIMPVVIGRQLKPS
jgi:hypothetical protein